MAKTPKTPAPSGDLKTFAADTFTHDRVTHRVFRKGSGPVVIVITELPGISPQVLGFADRVVALGFTAVLPDLFGTAGQDPLSAGLPGFVTAARTVAGVCISREFTVWATRRSSPVTSWLRALARHEHSTCGGPGVGVVGMCFSGGFALAMAVDPVVVVPVLSQPSLPLAVTPGRKRAVDCDEGDLDVVARRCAGGLRVLGLRFHNDPFVPAERFAFLHERLGEGFIAVELRPQDGHPDQVLPRHHSVLTRSLVDEPDEPTRDALDQVLTLLTDRLGAAGPGGGR